MRPRTLLVSLWIQVLMVLRHLNVSWFAEIWKTSHVTSLHVVSCCITLHIECSRFGIEATLAASPRGD